MVDALSIALSGLRAHGTRLGVAANNIANASTTGVLPTATSPASTVYRPLSVSYVALTAGAGNGAGVSAQISEDAEGYTAVYDPSSFYANEEGFIAAPNVDLMKEITDVLESKLLYKANLATIKTEREMTDELLNIIT